MCVKKSIRRNKERNRYAKLKTKVDAVCKEVDPLGIPNCNFSLIDNIDDIECCIKYKKQRIERGFDDTECWNLNTTIAAFILPRLKVFKEQMNAWPGVEPYDTFEKWEDAIDKMIYSFDHIVYEDKYDDERDKKYGINWNDIVVSRKNKDGNYELVKTENYLEEVMNAAHEDKMKEIEKIQEGLDLFAKNFSHLWW